MRIMVTGGAGYIGSHAARRLLADGHHVTIVDNLSTGARGSIGALRTLPGSERLSFHELDIADRPRMERVLRDEGVEAVMHFAAFANLRESVFNPLMYYRNNTASALALIEACDAADISRFVFSSTCATYGELPDECIPIREDYPHRSPINPYGHSKLAVEHMLEDYADQRNRDDRRPDFGYAVLRYFNVAGCDSRGLLGEDRTPHIRIIPIIVEAALGRRAGVTIFGTDYPTDDGTCVRDYIHVDDLVDAHVAVMDALQPGEKRAYNLGIGRGYSIRELIDATRRVTGVDFPVREGPRALGDPAKLYCDPGLIRRELGWSARIDSIDDIIRSAWQWMKANPEGYASLGF